jgi:SAM-dependent methyltransferase
VAAATGADLIGIDIAESALVAARDRAERMGQKATFRRGEFEATGLDDASVDAMMSVDALLFTPSKEAAFVEFRRILRPGGRLVLTSWDYHSQPVGRPPQVPDHRPLAEAAGFEVLAYDTTTGGGAERARRPAPPGRRRGARSGERRARRGGPGGLREMNATVDTMIRRFFLVAQAR